MRYLSIRNIFLCTIVQFSTVFWRTIYLYEGSFAPKYLSSAELIAVVSLSVKAMENYHCNPSTDLKVMKVSCRDVLVNTHEHKFLELNELKAGRTLELSSLVSIFVCL